MISRDRFKYFFIGMGSAFNIWGNYYTPEYVKNYSKFCKTDTSIESVWKDVGDCLNWSVGEFNNAVKQK